MDVSKLLPLASFVLGGGMSGVRVAAKRLNWELPGWIDIGSGILGLALIALALLLALRLLLPPDSLWPETFVYSVICIVAIFAAGYLPARTPTKVSTYKTEWEHPLAESFFLHLRSFDSAKRATFEVKIMATKQGTSIARFLAQVLKHYDWKLKINQDDGSYVFPASTPFRGARVRYRDSKRAEVPGVFDVVAAFVEIPTTVYFPESDATMMLRSPVSAALASGIALRTAEYKSFPLISRPRSSKFFGSAPNTGQNASLTGCH